MSARMWYFLSDSRVGKDIGADDDPNPLLAAASTNITMLGVGYRGEPLPVVVGAS